MELIFRRRNWSPLLLAVIFITFFHSVLSRHRIRHYKDRFKRQQGAHLYLPESYVSEGGEEPDRGPWTDWSEPSPCSRTCGGGVSTQFRQCQQGYSCDGPDRRHFSCNTQDCPDTGDFRSQQCSQYDEVPFENIHYQWVPYTKGPNPCELNCMPKGQRFYYRHAPTVIDGTRCNDESLDVCVNGQCQPVGCDMMLGSNLKEDDCRVCGGDGSTCNTITNTLELNDIQVGYNDILLIPGGATNIVVEEISPSNNYLAVRNTSGHYYLNGNWRIDIPRTIDFAGSKFHYERYPHDGFAAPDKIFTLGPIEEPLFIVLLYQDATVPVKYKYSLPTNVQPGSDYETYAWTFDEFTTCTATCGGGIQHRNVSCAGRKTLEPVDETLCDASRKPETSRKCNEIACEAQWVPHPWEPCSRPCGEEGGTQTRDVSCQQIVSNGYPTLADESECRSPKPPTEQKCNQGVTCAQWHLDPWKPCDHLCGEGKQTRQVKCFIKDANNKIQILDDVQCEAIEAKPATEQSCSIRPCEGLDWIASEWSGCDSICGLTNETRKIFCATASGQIYSDELCDESEKPEVVRKCEENKNESCNYLWYASQWSECSAKCGKGIQTRTLFCGLSTADGVKKVEDAKCDQTKSFEVIKNCTGTEECDGEWFSGPWGECSKPCGGGEKTKKVVCIKGNEVVDVSHCDSTKIIFSQEDCNEEPCTEDAELPVDKQKTTPLQETTTEAQPTTTEQISSTETETLEPAESTVGSSIITDKEGTSTDLTASDISEITKSIDFTTEPQATESDKSTDEDDYEIVAADSCDDGEWVDVQVMGVEMPKEPEAMSETTEESATGTTEALESSYSIYDTMMSDGTTMEETPITGSGDGQTSTVEEGSGTEPSSIVTDSEEGSSVSYILSSSEISTMVDVSTETTTESAASESDITTEMSASTEESASTSEVSGSTTEISSSTEESGSTTEVSSSTTDSSSSTTGALLGVHQCQEPFDACADLECPYEIESYIDENQCFACRCKESESTTDSSTTESSSSELSTITETITTETSESSSSTESASTSESTSESSSSTETTEITETSESSTSSTESSETTTGFSETSETPAIKEEPGAEAATPPPRALAEDETTIISETSTTEGSTEAVSSSSESTEESSMSTSEGTTESESTSEISSTESSTTEISGSTTEFTESSTATGSTEFDIFSSTSESSESTTSWPTTHITEIFKKKQKMCKRKKILQCKKTPYGCCWDNIHAAKGPFDKGCPTPATCKESSFGCCPDGVSAALGPKNRGCPSSQCNETLFGCCWDQKTPAEGNDDEGCPPKPPACFESKFGCCKDNATEAQGPKQKGCDSEEEATSEPSVETTTVSFDDCKESDYGCCPDGSTAQGPQFQGCNMPCSNTTFGCCPDKETPAHGYRGEGCCLKSAFGCCPDDVTPARGLNGDGCDCQYSSYGCCPDGVTPAEGYNNEGCGCKYSQFGCCPDDVTVASGPDYQGCLCHTFQFGCCPDGIAIAQGPHQQGCDCRQSEFGCCGDGKTTARGANQEGCTCDLSKFGCCMDGVTEAKGDNFEGCEELIVDHQESCSLPKDQGPCRNYSVKWFFDMSYGGCSRFWYGGCEGNDNRFKSKEECDGVCVKPQGIERCNLPRVNGSCDGYFLQWYYDKQAKQCSQFIYSGCLGNNNRFETREECTDLCAKDNNADPCEQAKAEGPCHGQYRKYFYNKSTGQCQEFNYGGCRGNNNNFATLEACNQRCATPGKKKNYCTIPKAEGNCTSQEAKWYYGAQHQRCLPFYYTGCNGNQNSFHSKDACRQDCPNEIAKDTCHLPADIGECGSYVTRWYWDTRYKKCNQFYYGGCGGNGNNYQSQEECEQSCNKPEQVDVRFETEPPQTQRPLPTPQVPSPPASRQPTLEEICSMSPDAGPCNNHSSHYYYDGVGICKKFSYGGCGGNYNNFESEDVCLQYCGSTRVLPQQSYTTRGPPVYDTQCYEDADPGNCTEQYQAYYYDVRGGSCKPFAYTGCGGNRNRFYSEEDCQRQCGDYRGQDICNLDQDTGPCRGFIEKYYYDRFSRECKQFVYGGCRGNGNRFSSPEECAHYCKPPEEPKPTLSVAEVCQLSADQGTCPESNLKRWYFDNTQGECKAFIFSGCGGNSNNFKTFQSCLDYCKDFLPHTESPVHEPDINQECQLKFEECTNLRCPYGIEAYVDENDCNGCRCRDPCKDFECPEATQCGIDLNRNKTSPLDADFVAICRETNKTGQCPYPTSDDTNCDIECRTDADCTLHLKCCATSCGTACVEPEKPLELVTQTSQPGYTLAPQVDVYYPPKIDAEIYEPEVSALLGDQAILNCAVSGNPNPKIVWSKDNMMIDGTQPRYRIRLDQTLQIITLHKTDSGVYLCTADNAIGAPIQNQIKLEVQDSAIERPVTILNGKDPELLVSNIVTSFNSPATLYCYALGWPMPAVTWWKEDELIPLKNREFEVTKDYSLLVHSVQLRNLGVYTCQAYNGKGQAASWSVTVRAQGPYYSTNPADVKYMQYVVNPPEAAVATATTRGYQRPTPQPYVPPEYFTEPSPDLVDPNEIFPHLVPEAEGRVPDSVYIVPVRANITTNEQNYPTGSNVEIRCDVYGYPQPQVQWYKDGIPLETNERISESETHTLTIKSADKSDSGRYQCEATNQYSKAATSIEILIEGMYIHPSCTDNQFFANCKLIVKAQFCNHKYYAKFCCRSCTEAGQLVSSSQQNAIDSNSI